VNSFFMTAKPQNRSNGADFRAANAFEPGVSNEPYRAAFGRPGRPRSTLTGLLRAWSAGDRAALDRLTDWFTQNFAGWPTAACVPSGGTRGLKPPRL
jgi:hypothetical protein